MSICFGLQRKTSGNPEFATTKESGEGKSPEISVWLDANRERGLIEQVRTEVLRTFDNKITFL